MLAMVCQRLESFRDSGIASGVNGLVPNKWMGDYRMQEFVLRWNHGSLGTSLRNGQSGIVRARTKRSTETLRP